MIFDGPLVCCSLHGYDFRGVLDKAGQSRMHVMRGVLRRGASVPSPLLETWMVYWDVHDIGWAQGITTHSLSLTLLTTLFRSAAHTAVPV